MKKLAIIGASSGQLPLVKKAKELGIETYCFAWEQGAVCKYICDRFYPISIFETDEIVRICKEINVDGVVTSASEETALIAAIVAENLGLNTTSPNAIRMVQNKMKVREVTADIPDLSKPSVFSIANPEGIIFPCVVKPIKGSAKKGVSFCVSAADFNEAINYALKVSNHVIAEEYIGGKEYSVETISFHGNHQIVQITRKVSSGYPHFVELEHHQPAPLSDEIKSRVNDVVSKILSKVGITDGASHVEIKIDGDRIFLIEINPRGGGDRISDTLTSLSTDFDYLAAMIMVALDSFEFRPIKNISYSGIMYLTGQNSRISKFFDCPKRDWMLERYRDDRELTESTSNYDRNGYILYNSNKPLNL